MVRRVFTPMALILITAGSPRLSMAHPDAPGAGPAAESAAPASRPTFGAVWSTNLSTAELPADLGRVSRRNWNGGGVVADVPLNGRWSLEARLLWNRKGARLQPTGLDGFRELSAQYLSAPVLLKLKAGTTTRPYLAAGAEISRRLSATTRTKFGTLDITTRSTSDVEPWDVAAVIGGGLERHARRGTLLAGAVYSHGLRNALADSADVAWAKTRTFTVLAGVRF